jgi:hypothetical protein
MSRDVTFVTARVAPLSLALSLALGSGACALFSLDLDALQAEAEEESDAAAPAAAADGESGAGSIDGTSSDGSTDAGTTRFSCASLSPAPTFCTDFDTAGSIQQGWSAKVGAIELESSLARSTPNAVRVLVTPTEESAYLQKDFAAITSGYGRASLAVDVRVAPGQLAAVNVARVQLGGGSIFLRLAEQNAFLSYDSPSAYRAFSALRYPPLDAWFRLELTVEVGAPESGVRPATVRMKFDGDIVAERAVVLEEAVGDVVVLVGTAGGKTTSGNVFLRFDNVAVNLD